MKLYVHLLLWVNLLFVAGTAVAGPKYGKNAIPLSSDSAYVRMAGKSDFWKLIGHFQTQASEKGGAAASATTVLNAFVAKDRADSGKSNFSVDELFKLAPKLKKQSASTGKGFGIENFAEVLNESLAAAEGGPYVASFERFDGKDVKGELKRLEKLLSKNDRSGEDFIIANYLTGVAMGDRGKMNAQFSIVAAFDSKKKRVLLMDPDRKNYEPYWVPLDKFLDSMNTSDPGSSKKRGLVMIEKGQAEA